MMHMPFVLLVVHFLGDFLAQSDWMAVNKSKRWDALTLHVLIYSACFLGFGLRFVAWTFLTHFITDAITSRATSLLWFFQMEPGIWAQAPYTVPKHDRTLVNPWTLKVPNYRHWFFVFIGLDQLIHYGTLTLTYWGTR